MSTLNDLKAKYRAIKIDSLQKMGMVTSDARRYAELQEKVVMSEAVIRDLDSLSLNEWVRRTDRLPEKGGDESYPHCSKLLLVSDGETVYGGYYEHLPGETAGKFIDEDGDEMFYIREWMYAPPPSPPQPK